MRSREKGEPARSERHFRQIFESAAVGIAVLDIYGRVVDSNRALEEMLGYPSDELTGMTIREVTHSDDLKKSLELFGELLAGQRESYELEHRYVRKDGDTLWGSARVAVVRDDRGTPELAVASIQDIDGRKRAEERHRDAERRYQTLVEQLPLVTYIDALDDSSSNIYTSPQLESILGYTVEEWQSDPELFVKLLHPADRERVLAEVARTNATGTKFLAEYRLAARDGRTVWFRDESVNVLDDEGRPVYSQGYLLDITERKRAEDELRETTQTLQALVHASPAAIVGFDRGGRVMLWNPAAESMFGWAEDEALGRFNPFVAEDRREEFLSFLGRVCEGESWHDMEIERERKDGSRILLSASSAPLRAANQQIIGMVSVLFDVSERRQAEEAIRDSEKRFRTLIENIPGIVYRCAPDADWTMEFVSDDITEITGYPASDFVGNAVRTYASVVHADDVAAVQEAVDQALAERRPFIVEYRIVREDGGERWVWERGQPVFSADGAILWLDGVIFDVTGRKLAAADRDRLLVEAEAAREQLAEQNEQLRELDKMKDEFVALVSHELRTPLTSILGYLELLLEGEVGAVTDDQRYFLAVVERNSHRLLRLVGDLLFIAQIEAGKLAIDRYRVDLMSIARDCIEAARPRAAEKNITLGLEGQPVQRLTGDRVRLAQLLDNLVSNAIKFTPDGGRVDVRVGSRTDEAFLVVTDTGIGITTEDQERLFERFFRTPEATRKAIQGTGLGLAITKAIAEAHGGSISVESNSGGGTTFLVSLPLDSAGDAEWSQAA